MMASGDYLYILSSNILYEYNLLSWPVNADESSCKSICQFACNLCTYSMPPKCLRCTIGYYLYEGECVLACPHNRNFDGFKCCPANCVNCETSPSVCSMCEKGFYVNYEGVSLITLPGGCATCPIECTACVNSLICTECAKGYVLSINKCVTISCNSGYYLDAVRGACQSCSAECNSCLNSTYCYSCNKNHFLTTFPSDPYYQNQCPSCDMNNCEYCASVNSCGSCLYGFTLSSHGNCVTLDGDSKMRGGTIAGIVIGIIIFLAIIIISVICYKRRKKYLKKLKKQKKKQLEMNQEAGICQDQHPNDAISDKLKEGGDPQHPGTQPVYFYPQQYPVHPMGFQSQQIGYLPYGKNSSHPGMSVYSNQSLGGVPHQGQPAVLQPQGMSSYDGPETK
jgi:hypothetical protein